MKKISVILIFIILAVSELVAIEKVIVKANIIHGESFVTANINPTEIESIFCKALIEKGFEITDDILISDENLLFLDIYVYQFPYNMPSIAVTIRSKTGTNYFDKKYLTLFASPKKANIDLANSLAARIPREINRNIYYNPNISNVIEINTISIYGIAINSIFDNFRSKYTISIKWPNEEIPEFALRNEFENYLAYCSNLLSLKGKLKGQLMNIQLKINKSGRFEIQNIECPFELNNKQKEKIENIISAFPLWIVNKEIEGTVLSLGFK